MSDLTKYRLPVIDLAGLRAAEPGALNSVAQAVRDACRATGFFYIKNHEVPTALLQSVLTDTARLFSLPASQKKLLDIVNSGHMRGYFGYGADRSDGINGDFKEGFDLGLDLPLTDKLVRAKLPFYGPNVWPDRLPGFKPNLTAYYNHMLRLGSDLLRAFSVSLGGTESFFKDCFAKPIAQLRLLKYPAHTNPNITKLGAGEHTDFGCITIILQDETDGLEIRTSGGKWISVPALENTLVVNVGDLMQRWTNDQYEATVHRVINRTNAPRYSAAFFMDPDYHTKVDCLPICTSTDRPPRYEPIIVGDYMNERFHQTTRFAR